MIFESTAAPKVSLKCPEALQLFVVDISLKSIEKKMKPRRARRLIGSANI
jgi:hypothetical protein